MTVTLHLHSVAPEYSELWIEPNTPHTQALYVHPDEWVSSRARLPGSRTSVGDGPITMKAAVTVSTGSKGAST